MIAMNIKDILFFALVSLAVGLWANHYFNLDIGFLTHIENSLVSSGQSGKSSTRGIGGMGAESIQSGSAECESLRKSFGDAKTSARDELAAAKKEGDVMKIKAAEARLEELSRRERAVCK